MMPQVARLALTTAHRLQMMRAHPPHACSDRRFTVTCDRDAPAAL